MKKEYVTPEMNFAMISMEDILVGSDVIIDVEDLFE